MNGQALLPPLLAAAFLLLWAGVGKLRQPATAAALLRSLGLPFPLFLVRVTAVVEIGVAGFVVVWPRAAALAMAVLYLVFAWVVGAQLRQSTTLPCGCLGSHTTPPSRGHLILNLMCLSLSVAAVAAPPPAYSSLTASAPLASAMTALAAILVALLASTAVELFPQTMAAWPGERVERAYE